MKIRQFVDSLFKEGVHVDTCNHRHDSRHLCKIR